MSRDDDVMPVWFIRFLLTVGIIYLLTASGFEWAVWFGIAILVLFGFSCVQSHGLQVAILYFFVLSAVGLGLIFLQRLYGRAKGTYSACVRVSLKGCRGRSARPGEHVPDLRSIPVTSTCGFHVRFKCADMPEADRTFLQMVAVFAEWERGRISQRTHGRRESISQFPDRLNVAGLALGNQDIRDLAQRLQIFPRLGELHAQSLAKKLVALLAEEARA